MNDRRHKTLDQAPTLVERYRRDPSRFVVEALRGGAGVALLVLMLTVARHLREPAAMPLLSALAISLVAMAVAVPACAVVRHFLTNEAERAAHAGALDRIRAVR